MTYLSFIVHGVPGAQGSKRHVGHGVMIESSKKVKPWRTDVKTAAEAAIERWEREHNGGGSWEPSRGPVLVDITFRFARPQSHYGTGRNATTLKVTAPEYVTSRAAGDLDKLVRSTGDALTAAGVIADDSLIAQLSAAKVYINPGETPGARVIVHPIEWVA